MLSASIIVFRESLEAAILVSIIAAATKGLPKRTRWIALGIGAGIVGSLLVAGLSSSIAQLADGVGQEIFNATILSIAVLMLGWHNIWMVSHGAEMAGNAKKIGQAIRKGTHELSAIAIVVALAVLREGSETVLFLHGVASASGSNLGNIVLGGSFGLLTGVIVGTMVYAGLLRIPLSWLFSVTSGLLLLMAAGLASQVARFLIQGDLISVMTSPLWDSSNALPIDSILGSMLHILIGYDAQPSGMQAIFYASTIIIITTGATLVRRQTNQLKLKAI